MFYIMVLINLAFSGIMMGASSIIGGVKQSVDICADEIRAKKRYSGKELLVRMEYGNH